MNPCRLVSVVRGEVSTMAKADPRESKAGVSSQGERVVGGWSLSWELRGGGAFIEPDVGELMSDAHGWPKWNPPPPLPHHQIIGRLDVRPMHAAQAETSSKPTWV